MIIIKPPSPIVCRKGLPKVFLAGTIDMGEAINWQADIENRLSDLDGYIFNPLRDYFDPSMVQSIHNPNFKEQVLWEQTGLEFADIILMYLLPGSKSVISMLELGQYVSSGKIVVYCPPGFWRKGNVDIVCELYKIPVYATVEDTIEAVREKIVNHPAGKFYVVPNDCGHYTEMCCCADWAVYDPHGKKHSTFQDKTLADEYAKTLNTLYCSGQ